MKHLLTILASVFSFHLFAAPMATTEWVKNYIAQALKQNSPSIGDELGEKQKCESIDALYTSNVKGEDGAEYELSVRLSSGNTLQLVVISSNVAGVDSGTIYSYKPSLGVFESSENSLLSVIRVETFEASTVTTNLSGLASASSKPITHYTATDALGREYKMGTIGARDCLVSDAGGKIAFVVSTAQGETRRQSAVRALSLIPSAFANEWDEVNSLGGVAHYCGNLYIGTITIRRKGRDETHTINIGYSFDSGVGSGTVAEAVIDAFDKWYASPKSGIYSSAKAALAARAKSYLSWNLPPEKNEINADNDKINLRYSDIYESEAFKNTFAAACSWIEAEYVRIFKTLHNRLKEHSCPSLKPGEKIWKMEWGCKCRHTYPSLTDGEDVKCDMADVEQHDWQTYRLENGQLALAEDGAGCTICSRCFEHREDHGAVHVEVDDNAPYCGCCCGYYYEKKESDSPEGAEGDEIELPVGGIYGGAEIIEQIPVKGKEDVSVECTDENGNDVTLDVTVETLRYIVLTGTVDSIAIPWQHVQKTTKGANGKLIKVTASANNLMEEKSARKMHIKPQHPMRCTCRCGVEHWFKASPCPEICRGCNIHRDAFKSIESASDAQIWADHGGSEHWTGDVREFHSLFDDGYWADETYFIMGDDGEKKEYRWSNSIGGYDESGNVLIPSPYADWFEGITTNGLSACGCACKRFFSDALGQHGADEKSISGEVVGKGYHGSFHCYGSKRVSEIKCPFTKWYYEQTNPDFLLPSCTCLNHDWEVANDPKSLGVDTPFGWCGKAYGSVQKDKVQTVSLACDRVCMWCYPASHNGGNIEDTQMSHTLHTGIALAPSALKGDIADYYAAYLDMLGGKIECGCICQAFKESTCLAEDGSIPAGDYHFPVAWSSVWDEDYHYSDMDKSCICACGKMHIAVTPTSWAKYRPLEKPLWNWSRCASTRGANGVCQTCGYYNESGLIENLSRAEPKDHVFTHGCRCDCADGSGKVFTPKSGGYKGAVRGWSAEQDKDNYPNNTRSESPGFRYKDDEHFKDYHRGNDGHLCSCRTAAGHHLYHKHDEGEKCPDSCKHPVGGHHCDHVPTYYVYNAANKGYAEKYGEHYRSPDADYCGCDCGEKIHTLDTQGKEIRWCVIPDSDCYCFGRYAPTSPYIHSEHRLCEHKNVTPTGNVITNEADCGVCLAPYPTTAHEFVCMNGHIIMGREQGTCQKEHPEKQQCRCGCCDDSSACDCPYCLGYQAADKCTCQERESGLSDGKLKFTSPLLTVEDVSEMLEQIDLNEVFDIDGDDPVYEIAEMTFYDNFNNVKNLTTIKFNYCTNVGRSAFAFSFYNCPNLRAVEFSRLEKAGYGSFYDAFRGAKDLNFVFPSLRTAEESSFSCIQSLQSFSAPLLETVSGDMLSSCSKLESVYLPAAKIIADDAFSYCSKLSTVSIPNATTIGKRVFYEAFNLKKLHLPKATSLSTFSPVDLDELHLDALTNVDTLIMGLGFMDGQVAKKVYVPSLSGRDLYNYFIARSDLAVLLDQIRSGVGSLSRTTFYCKDGDFEVLRDVPLTDGTVTAE